jgi:hypothetical protein
LQLPGDFLELPGKFDVFRGDAAGVKGGEFHRDPVVNDCPRVSMTMDAVAMNPKA